MYGTPAGSARKRLRPRSLVYTTAQPKYTRAMGASIIQNAWRKRRNAAILKDMSSFAGKNISQFNYQAGHELNYIDTAQFSTGTISGQYDWHSILNPITQGTGPTQRIGSKIFMHNLYLNLHIECRQVTVPPYQTVMSDGALMNKVAPAKKVRILILYDKNPAGFSAMPSLSGDILISPGTAGAQKYSLWQYNRDNLARFEIVADFRRECDMHYVTQSAAASSSASAQSICCGSFRLDKRVKIRRPSIFKATSTNADWTDFMSGCLMLYVVDDSTDQEITTTGSALYLNGTTRLFFKP